MSIAGIIILSIPILIGISGIILGIYLIIEFQDGEGALAIILSVILLLISSLTIVYIINNNTETVNESIVDLYFFLFLFKFL